MNDTAYLPCGHMCVRGSDIGIGVVGDPVAYAHPGCPIHGHCEAYIAADVAHGCGLKPCANCTAYEDEHNYVARKTK